MTIAIAPHHSTETIQREWTARHDALYTLALHRCRGNEETAHNATCWGWEYFVANGKRYVGNWDKLAVRAMTHGLRRKRRTFGSPSRQGKWDALVAAATPLEAASNPLAEIAAQTPDDDAPTWQLSDIPESLQPVASGLALGWTRTAIADYLGVHRNTVSARVREIGEWLLDHHTIAG